MIERAIRAGYYQPTCSAIPQPKTVLKWRKVDHGERNNHAIFPASAVTIGRVKHPSCCEHQQEDAIHEIESGFDWVFRGHLALQEPAPLCPGVPADRPVRFLQLRVSC